MPCRVDVLSAGDIEVETGQHTLKRRHTQTVPQDAEAWQGVWPCAGSASSNATKILSSIHSATFSIPQRLLADTNRRSENVQLCKNHIDRNLPRAWPCKILRRVPLGLLVSLNWRVPRGSAWLAAEKH